MESTKKKKDNKIKSRTVILAWTFNPLSSNFKEVIFVIFLASLFSVAVYWNFKDIFLCVLSILMFIFSLSSFFFPTGYVLDEEYITIRHIYEKKYPWSRFRRFAQNKRGIHLSPYIKPSAMDEYRGISLFCEGENLTQVLNLVKEKIS